MAIGPRRIERFRADLSALIGAPEKLGIAYSAGPDSLALLLLAEAAFPGCVEAATVDHGLRADSAAEAELAASTCARMGVPHAALPVTVRAGNVQSEARRARYAALNDWAAQRGLAALLTAHHADDQAETFLMRANRGSGLFGLAGVRAIKPAAKGAVIVARPLLGWRRAELALIVRESGFEAAQDPSNADTAFDRVQMRHALADADAIGSEGVARSASLLAALEDDISAVLSEELERAAQIGAEHSTYQPFAQARAPRPVLWAELCRMICQRMGRPATRAEAAKMVAALTGGQGLNIAGTHVRASGKGGDALWEFTPENPRRGS